MLIYALSMLLVLGISSTDIFISSLPAIALHYNVSIDIATMTLSAATAGVAIGSLLAAMFSDRFGRRTTLLCSNGAYIIFSLLIGYIDNIWAMIALRFLQMGSVSLNFVIARQVIKDKYCHQLWHRPSAPISRYGSAGNTVFILARCLARRFGCIFMLSSKSLRLQRND